MFRDKIPEAVLESQEVSNFVSILDGLQEYKTESINKALRVHNPLLSLDKKWLIKQLEEYGVYGFPEGIPMEILTQFVGNIAVITSFRGSKLGAILLCSVLTEGEVTLDDTEYYKEPKLLLLNSPNSALLVGDTDDQRLFLASDTDDLNDFKTLDISIESPLWKAEASVEVQDIIKDFLEKMLLRYVPYSNAPTINVTYTDRETRYIHPHLNSFLI